EAVWTGLTGSDSAFGPSVHLSDWPDPASLPADPGLVAAMDEAREVCSAAHSIRKARGLRARLPLRSLVVASPDSERLEPFVDLIRAEVNVGNVALTTDVASLADQTLAVVFRVAAPRLGGDTPAVAAAAKAGDWSLLGDGRAQVGPAVLEPGEFELQLRPRSEETSRTLPGRTGLVVLDTESDPEQELEGLARDVIREVQRGRRDAGLNVSDRITLELDGSPQVLEAVELHRRSLMEACLVADLRLAEDAAGIETLEEVEALEADEGSRELAAARLAYEDSGWTVAELDEPNWLAFRVTRP
ncbi:MAG: hypothetical protein J2P58_10575, partial [Acidimicrobiaceae bacterium]|nr:hypothetical protein [Acidimicrobiaceae bacterium]